MSAKIAIIGGGLAATACAYALRQGGAVPVIFEADNTLAAGASGNFLSMYNQRFQKNRDGVSDYYATAYDLALKLFTAIQATNDIGFEPCGALYLLKDEEERAYYAAMLENGSWKDGQAVLLDPAQTSEKAGIQLDFGALCLPRSGFICPATLCRVFAQDMDVRLSTSVRSLAQSNSAWKVNEESFDAVILACGAAVKNFMPCAWMPVENVRGQIAICPATSYSAALSCNLFYGGHISKPVDGMHAIGSTFQKGDLDTAIRAEDNAQILAKLAESLPALAQGLSPRRSCASLRTASKDRRPIAGPVPNKKTWTASRPVFHENLYVSTAHGSYGVLSSLAAAQSIADDILSRPAVLCGESRKAIAPDRYLARLERRGRL